MDRNYCLIVFIVYMSYSDTQKVAKCCLYEEEKKIDVQKKKGGGGATSKKKGGGGNIFKKKRGGDIGSCPHVPVKQM